MVSAMVKCLRGPSDKVLAQAAHPRAQMAQSKSCLYAFCVAGGGYT